MKNILLLTDFSENARNAITYGIALFGEGAKYTLMNTYSEPSMSAGSIVSVRSFVKEGALEGLEEDMEFIKDTFPDKDINVEIAAKYGSVEAVLKRFEDDVNQDYDYVVMGTKGKTADTWLVGSVAKDVVRTSHIPVIVVPEEAKYDKMNSITYAAALEENETFLIDSVVEFSKEYDAALTLLHIDRDAVAAVDSSREMEEIKNGVPYDKNAPHLDGRAEH